MPRKQIELQFPFKGLDESSAYTRQRGGQYAYSTGACMNVVAFDPATGRNRGGARAGLRKFDGASEDVVSGPVSRACDGFA